MKPFERPPFSSLPDRPRIAHTFLELPRRQATVRLGRSPILMSFRERGEGPPLLLLHGLMTSSYSWRYAMAPLASLGFRVIAPDLPGAGASEIPVQPCDTALLTQSIGAFQDALDIAGCRVIGNSMAGYLAMRLALESPGRVGRLVNVHSPGVPMLRLYALRRALRLPGVRSSLSAVIARDPERWVYRNVHYYDETLKSREETREYAEPLRSARGRAAFLSWMADGLDPDVMTAFLRELSVGTFPVPLMLLYAREDPMVPPSVGARLGALVPSAEKVWFDRSSHFAHVDTPGPFVDAVRGFLLR
ncbi:MAG: alpha/beta hydrolase [Myxococcota bacterium]